MAVSKRLRFEILRRDGFTCRYCGAKAPDVQLRVDHVVPVALGGTDDPTNLVTACEPCNSGKSSAPLGGPILAQVADDALRWARAMAIVAEGRAAARAEARDRNAAFLAHWETWTYTRGIHQYTFDLPGGWRNSIDQFLAAGLEMGDLTELVDVAMGSRSTDPWRYFCGCCWRRIGQAHHAASAIVQLLNDDSTEGGSGG